MSATHIGMPSAAVIPESLAIISHFDACVPRRSITRSKSNIGIGGSCVGGVAVMRLDFERLLSCRCVIYASSTASAPLTASALSMTVFSSEVACTEMFSAKNRASVT